MEINKESQHGRLNSLFIFTFICLLLTLPQQIFAENQKVTLTTKSITLKTAFEEIEKQTGYSVDYEDTNISLNKIVNVSINNLNLPDAIKTVLKNTGYTYSIEGKHIVISTQKVNQAQKRKITGKVNDANGEPIIGANIVEKGTTNGTITDMNGDFTLEVPEKAYC